MNPFTLKFRLPFALLLMLVFTSAGGSEWEVAGTIDLTTRNFFDHAQWPGQDNDRTQISVTGSAEFRWSDDNARISIIPLARYDFTDDERSLIDLKEAYWVRETDSYELLVGVNTVFWGVTESVHLVDIVNQTDAVADIDGEDKLGQPMINLDIQRDWGRVSVFLLPGFRERTFAGTYGRLRPPLPVVTDNARYESSSEQNHTDVALRYSNFFGNVDIGLNLFRGTSREARLIPEANGELLLPYYDQISQLGLDVQYTGDAWLWKLEAIARDTQNDSFLAAVGGLEYTFYQIGSSPADLGIILEYQYDGRNKSEPTTLADNDIFSGIRLALNDTQDTALLAGIGYDHKTSETFITIEADRRLGQRFVLEFRGRLFENSASDDNSYALRSDDYLELELGWYF